MNYRDNLPNCLNFVPPYPYLEGDTIPAKTKAAALTDLKTTVKINFQHLFGLLKPTRLCFMTSLNYTKSDIVVMPVKVSLLDTSGICLHRRRRKKRLSLTTRPT